MLHADSTEANKQLNLLTGKREMHQCCLQRRNGAGIDCPSVHLVVRVTMATSLSSYVQESGQLSRDGIGALAVAATGTKARQRRYELVQDNEKVCKSASVSKM